MENEGLKQKAVRKPQRQPPGGREAAFPENSILSATDIITFSEAS
jgi:hypothetical protein